jgi:lambda repressor-like predicted transcriptional regulator
VVVAANLARAAQESLKTRVEIARSYGATWRMIAKAIRLTPWRAWRRKWETRPLDAPH